MLPVLTVLIELQALDSALDAARKRLAEFPVLEKAAAQHSAAAASALDAAKASLAESIAARKLIEKDVAGVDTRLARFEEHKAAVKTNEQFHALQHEMEVGKQEKSALEEQVLEMMMQADELAAHVKTAEAGLAAAKKEADALRAAHAAEKTKLDAEIVELSAKRSATAAQVDKPSLSKYETLLKGRKGVAVARMEGELCTACHVKARPALAAQVRRNDAILACENCQRILYYIPPPAPAADAAPAS